ncbi:Gfo/Idh/MocA family oxidoreductase [Microbacterium esteraromaticum]|uniref:Gfo/Idh/MocA family protein n=1 Tax=Microbacterium esteraromaticum TaxID=57043 RepID=UPI0019D38B0C|nr:Gfo/Idh/MocA family oxidoreductase [Microbacterium esteraromaticum]MBN7794302.1 Gfo/Idh/MocA family oxidoreductase [Microbacterium esteraromaticum]MBN8425172.1 Gfo/Idh/MocA family oxidoreductase [Microbacterium esteraromaticum]
MRIGLIGAGAVAPFHITAAAENDGLELTAVCDIDADAAARAASGSGAAVFTDHRRMLGAGVVDAVIVNTPHATHLPIGADAAAAGAHVMVEKPMATTLQDCDRLAELCRQAGVGLTIGHIQHYMPEKVAAQRVLATGELGAVRMIRDNRSTDYRPGSRSEWFFSPEIAGGGALMNIGGHCLDRSLWFGGGRAVEMLATTVHRFGAAVETDGAMLLRLDNGVGVSITVVSDPGTRGDLLTIVCDRGVIEIDPRVGTTVHANGRSRVVHEHHADDIQRAFTAQLADFAAVIAGAEPTVAHAHARHVVELVLTAYRSADEGRALSLLPAGVPA